ncbi:MAG TPA: MarR family winged helix-turn-helix transcriptional regulator [Fimbriimonadaceae bacterium]|nr:MarR family winged helix-turn-helix transcriptional regulator [Fimbriimonadaceae bacterium]
MSRPLLGPRIASVYELQAEWLEPRLNELGVSWSSFQLLSTVASAGDEASQIEVARRLGVTAATLSESVQSHIERGLLRQVTSEKDKRVRLLVLTPTSTRLVQEIRNLVIESEQVMVKGLQFSETSNAASILDRVLSNLRSTQG